MMSPQAFAKLKRALALFDRRYGQTRITEPVVQAFATALDSEFAHVFTPTVIASAVVTLRKRFGRHTKADERKKLEEALEVGRARRGLWPWCMQLDEPTREPSRTARRRK